MNTSFVSHSWEETYVCALGNVRVTSCLFALQLSYMFSSKLDTEAESDVRMGAPQGHVAARELDFP